MVTSNNYQSDGNNTINDNTNVIRVKFWYAGDTDPQLGYLLFYKNLPGRNIQILHYYDSTYNAKVTVDVNWITKKVLVYGIVLPNSNWHVEVEQWL